MKTTEDSWQTVSVPRKRTKVLKHRSGKTSGVHKKNKKQEDFEESVFFWGGNTSSFPVKKTTAIHLRSQARRHSSHAITTANFCHLHFNSSRKEKALSWMSSSRMVE